MRLLNHNFPNVEGKKKGEKLEECRHHKNSYEAQYKPSH